MKYWSKKDNKNTILKPWKTKKRRWIKSSVLHGSLRRTPKGAEPLPSVPSLGAETEKMRVINRGFGDGKMDGGKFFRLALRVKNSF